MFHLFSKYCTYHSGLTLITVGAIGREWRAFKVLTGGGRRLKILRGGAAVLRYASGYNSIALVTTNSRIRPLQPTLFTRKSFFFSNIYYGQRTAVFLGTFRFRKKGFKA